MFCVRQEYDLEQTWQPVAKMNEELRNKVKQHARAMADAKKSGTEEVPGYDYQTSWIY